MKTKSIKYSVLSLLLTFGLSSCEDFFNILPLNEIVLENYYTEKADITSVLYSCYGALESSDCINKMALWGEIRSENFSEGASRNADLTQILKESILPTSNFVDWSTFYQIINRCNTVMYYAPLVKDRDPNYTPSEMRANIAEVKAIRALCYFYLIRAYKDVPFVTVPTIDDTYRFKVPATSGDSIVSALIEDLESAKNYAVRKYSDPVNNQTRFTRYSIWALLADLYLWQENYDKAIEYCDLIIDYKRQMYFEEKGIKGNNIDLELYKDIPLISEHPSGSNKSGNVATKIFGTGLSFESLFELNFVRNQSVSNSFITSYYGSNSTQSGLLSATSLLSENVALGTNSIFKVSDCRNISYMALNNSLYSINKYTLSSISYDTPLPSATALPTTDPKRKSDGFTNWIVYRLSDIVLMKAEALVQKAKLLVPANSTSHLADSIVSPYLQQSFALVSATYNRSNNLASNSADTLKYSNYNSIGAMEDLVLLERQRELMFEGKRWFDLLRVARREGNNDKLLSLVLRKQKSNVSASAVKLKSTEYLYLPYFETELKSNDLLRQNPVYVTDNTVSMSN